MKATVKLKDLQPAVAAARRATAERSTLPVLGHIKLEARDGQLSLSATDLEKAVTVIIPARFDSFGALTLPALLLSKLLHKLPAHELTIEGESDGTWGGAAQLSGCGIRVTLGAMEPEEMPVIPTGEGATPFVELAPADLRRITHAVAHAACKDDSRPILQSVLLHVVDGKLTAAATDGFRLAVSNLRTGARLDGEHPPLPVPARALTTLAQLLPGKTEPVCLSYELENGWPIRLHARCGGIHVVSRIIEGRYPDYYMSIVDKQPSEHTSVEVELGQLRQAIARAKWFAQRGGAPLKLTTEPGRLIIHSKVGEGVDCAEEALVGAMRNTAERLVKLNWRYLSEALSACTGRTASVELRGPNHPLIVRSENTLQLIMAIAVR